MEESTTEKDFSEGLSYNHKGNSLLHFDSQKKKFSTNSTSIEVL